MSEIKRKIRLSPSLQILLGFIVLILVGTFLLSLPIANKSGEWLNIVDAFFTSTSMVCVTGLTVVKISTTFTLFGQIVILFLIQIGALGIVSLTSLFFMLIKKKINFSSRLAIKESLNKDNIQGVVAFIKKVILITLIIEAVGALALLYSSITYTGSFWKGLFSAIFMSISAFCNVGIDIYGNEMGEFLGLYPFASNVLVQLPLMLLIILGSIGFIVLIDGFKNIRNNQHTKVVLIATAILIFGGAILYMIAEWNNPLTIGNMSTGEKILNSFFQSVSCRSAGCATISQASLTNMGYVLTIILMFIGGSPSSLAGGIKTTTLFVLLIFLFKKHNSNGAIVYRDRKFSSNIIYKAIKVLLYSIITIIVSVILLLLIEGNNFSIESIVFEVVSAITTTGFSMGITELLSVPSKIIISIVMFIGRVGMATILLAISSKTDASLEQVEYINTDIIVG